MANSLFNAGTWWRFDKYNVIDGYIRPAKGAKLIEYDLWGAYARSLENEDVPPPYESFLKLFDEVEKAGGLEIEQTHKVAKWCAENGLLGILLDNTQSVVIHPRWQYMGREKKLLCPVSTKYIRTGGQWVTSTYSSDTPTAVDRKYLGCPLSDAEVQKSHLKVHAVYSSHHLLQEYNTTPLSHSWAHFFPDVKEVEKKTYLYPQPLTKPFWEQYAERMGDFLRNAREFYHAIRSVRTKINMNNAGILYLNSFAESATMKLAGNEAGGLIQIWQTPSLMSAYAVMAIRDLTSNKLLVCESCKKVFVPRSRKQRLYCSTTCTQTAQTKKYRKAKAEALSLFRDGKSIQEIATLLKKKPEKIEKWCNAN